MIEKEHRFARCELCGKELDTTRDDVAQWTEGWMPVGGDDDDEILQPVRTNRWAHEGCVVEQEKRAKHPA
jgi:hypothetical protein